MLEEEEEAAGEEKPVGPVFVTCKTTNFQPK